MIFARMKKGARRAVAMAASGPVRSTFHGYAAATRVRPEWTPAYMVFQGGVPMMRIGSITGGGQVYGHEYPGFFQPVISGYSTPVTSIVAGGQIPSLPPFLQALMGGAIGQGS